MWKTFRAGVPLLTAGLALGGCDTATAPADPAAFDAEAALEDYQALAAVLEGDELDAFRALPGRIPFASSSATPAGPVAAPVISGFHRGVTFVYDPEAGEYRADPDRGGAPADGVRFVLYELDAGGTPRVDREVGHADLVDEGDGSAEDVALRLVVVHHDDTVLDYRTTVDWSPGRGAISARGFVMGDGVRLDFDVTLEGREGNGLEEGLLTFDLGVDARDFSVAGRVQGLEDGGGAMGEVDLDIRHGSGALSVSATGEDGVLDGTVFLDGQPFAAFQGPEGDLEITTPDGRALTWSEALVLQRAVDVVEDVFDFVEDLLDPVDEVVLLGLIL